MPDASQLLAFEDFQPGHLGTFGPLHVSRDDIVVFAREYDPQPMHLDDEAARQSMLGGLAGSGWHMCALMMRLICDGFLNRTLGKGAPGVDEVRWLRPMRPDSDLTLDVTVLDCRVSNSRPELGFVKMRYELRDQAGAALMTMQNSVMVGRRPAGTVEVLR